MKKQLSIAFLPLLLFSLFCCENGKEIAGTSRGELEIYYSYRNLAKTQLYEGDTIVVNLGDTFYVFVEEIGTSEYVGFYGDSKCEKQNIGDSVSLCVAKEAGLASMGAYGYDSETSADLMTNFFIKIPFITYTCLIIEDPSFTIDVENEKMKNVIQTELEESYAPAFHNYYTLECNTIGSGNLLLKTTASKDTIVGTFTSSDITKLNDIIMNYNDLVYNFTIKPKEADSQYERLLKQDLTEEFRKKYPSETINEVSIITLAYMRKK